MRRTLPWQAPSFMIKASEFRLVSVQCVVYTPSISTFSQPQVLTSVLGKFQDRFGGPVQVLPLGNSAPPELPIVILQSPDGQWRFQSGPARTDVFYNVEPGDGDRALSNIIAKCAEVCVHYVESTEPSFSRIALVLNRARQEDDPATVLINKFCTADAKLGPLRNSATFEIHNHKRYEIASLDTEINSWVRCKAANVGPDGCVVVEQDLNVPQDKTIKIGKNKLPEAFEQLGREADAILGIYFPEN